jgi:hypothetical protein
MIALVVSALNNSSHKDFLGFLRRHNMEVSDRQKIALLPNEGRRESGEWTQGIEVHDAAGCF